jgi:hypothetical protein
MCACERCSEPLVPCPDCAGQAGGYSIAGLLTCRRCRNSGRLCPIHEARWRSPGAVLSSPEIIAVEPAVGDQLDEQL